jgi:hypothetical protein
VFVEVPHTGSSAISQELRDLYDGEKILSKHSFYTDFLKIASPEEKKYFMFCGIRNPLDEAVSLFYKIKMNHKERYTDPKKLQKRTSISQRRANKTFEEIKEAELDFETYFMKSYKLPYNSWASLTKKNYDYLIRFENLHEDFAQALHLIGIEPVRPLPMKNPTAGRKRDYVTYYTPKMIPRAKRVFGPFMKQWGYEFPSEWGDCSVPWWNQLQFDVFNVLKVFVWKYLRI